MCDKKKNELTILVNSCDTYSDLWNPFFTLLKRYWNTSNIRILLNTETQEFSYDGLNIECVHPSSPNVPYGERMIQALNMVKTEFVVSFLDDFFIREQVKLQKIEDIIKWMKADPSIAYFNCDCTPTLFDWETDIYPGYKRIPLGNEYTLNMQVAVWRTEILKRFWRSNVTPWEWEAKCNIMAAGEKNLKFYCAKQPKSGFCNYLYEYYGSAVFRGKWMMELVQPLFEKEKIKIDYTKRGIYDASNKKDDSTKGEINAIGEKKNNKIVSFLKFYSSQIREVCRLYPTLKKAYIKYIIINVITRAHNGSADAFYGKQMDKYRKLNDMN